MSEPSSVPVIPAPPPRERTGPKRGRNRSRRPLAWFVALAIGAVAGALAYRHVEPVADLVDYWVALAL